MQEFGKYVRVSEILSRLRDRSEINPLVLETKAKVGTEVHDNIHKDSLGKELEFFTHPVIHALSGEVLRSEERGKGYFNSYIKWKEANKPNYTVMEERLYCDEMCITGQIDALFTSPTHPLTLLDFKCSYSADLEIWSLQAHYYYHLLTTNGHKNIAPEFIWLQLDKSGKKPKEHKIALDQKVLSRCAEEAIRYYEEKSFAELLD